MKVSIVTVCLNSARTIEDTIKSVLDQNYPDLEYIVIDGGSTDGTLEVMNRYRNLRSDTNSRSQTANGISKAISEKDGGMYDAMNKGIRLATGDIVGILNSDDMYASDDVIKTVAERFMQSGADCVWGDIVYVDKKDPNKIVRDWKSSVYKEGSFQAGWHPPHPAFFVKKNVYDKYGSFRTDFNTSADYELMLRFLERYKITSSYIPRVLVKMRNGGESNRSWFNLIRANLGCYRAFKINGLKTDLLFIIRKPLLKARQFIR